MVRRAPRRLQADAPRSAGSRWFECVRSKTVNSFLSMLLEGGVTRLFRNPPGADYDRPQTDIVGRAK